MANQRERAEALLEELTGSREFREKVRQLLILVGEGHNGPPDGNADNSWRPVHWRVLMNAAEGLHRATGAADEYARLPKVRLL